MQQLRQLALLSILLGTIVPEAHAEDEWLSIVEARTKTSVAGYMDSVVLYTRGKKTFVAQNETPARSEVRAYVITGTDRLRMEFEPYTRIFESPYRVSLGALEARISTALTPHLRFGGYHHSSHNFSDDDYGWGISLNSLYVEAVPYSGVVEALYGSNVQLSVTPHIFLTRRGSAHILTPKAVVRPEDVGETAWLVRTAFTGETAVTRFGTYIDTRGDDRWRMASASTGAYFAAMLWPSLLGEFGRHTYCGPYADLGWNLYETAAYGEMAWSIGLRLDLVVAKNTP